MSPESIRTLINSKPNDEPYTTAWADEIVLDCLNSVWYPHGPPYLLKLGVKSKLFDKKFELPPDRDGQYDRHSPTPSRQDKLAGSNPATESSSYIPWRTKVDKSAAGTSIETSSRSADQAQHRGYSRPDPRSGARPSTAEADAGSAQPTREPMGVVFGFARSSHFARSTNSISNCRGSIAHSSSALSAEDQA